MRASWQKEHPKRFGLLESLVHFNNDRTLHLAAAGWSVDSTRKIRHGYRMNRFVRVGVQFLVLAVAGVVGGFMAGSQTTRTVDADPGQMSALVPMMTQADLAAQDVAVSSTDLATTSITPVRIIDTRRPGAALGGIAVPWGALETRTVDAAGLGPIPADAVGVVLNVTALNATQQGTFLTLFPTGVEMPNASTLNPTPGEIAFNAATVLLGPDGTFEVYNYAGTVDVIIDVTAYMTRTLADDVGRLQTGELYVGRSSSIAVTDALGLHDEWSGVLGGSDALDSLVYGIELSDARYSDTAQVELEVVIDGGLLRGGEVCFRLATLEGGPMDSTMTCSSDFDPQVVLGTEYYVMSTERATLNGETVFLQAIAVSSDSGPTNAIISRWQFRVFDN